MQSKFINLSSLVFLFAAMIQNQAVGDDHDFSNMNLEELKDMRSSVYPNAMSVSLKLRAFMC